MRLLKAITLSIIVSTALTLMLEPNSSIARFLIGVVSGIFAAQMVRNSDEL